MKSTFQNQTESKFRIDFSNHADEVYVLDHDFSRDILKVDSNMRKLNTDEVNIKSFSENLYHDLLDKGMGSIENFEKLFHKQ